MASTISSGVVSPLKRTQMAVAVASGCAGARLGVVDDVLVVGLAEPNLRLPDRVPSA
jgi:hypothetical protein